MGAEEGGQGGLREIQHTGTWTLLLNLHSEFIIVLLFL